MKIKLLLPILAVFLLILSACNPTTEPSIPGVEEDLTPPNDAGATDASINEVSDSINQLSFDVYKYYDSEENIFISPYSLSTALSMVYEGSEGQTKEEMKSVLHYADENNRLPSIAAIQNQINKEDKEYELKSANALWVQEAFPLKDSYKTIMGEYYDGVIANIDFLGNPEGAADTINSWVKQNTNEKIKSIINKDAITPDLRMFLANAVYFKGDWEHEFKKSSTRTESFYKADGTTIQTDMMYQTEDFRYFEENNVQFLEMPYKDEEVAMFVMLPQKGQNVPEDYMSADAFNELKNKMGMKEVRVTFPKFKLEQSYDMTKTFADLGMPIAFTNNADFSKMSQEPLSISTIVHKTYVDVNEEGTEAAAVTGIGMGTTAFRPTDIVEFTADHPFTYIIYEKETGTILFMGKMGNPLA